MIIDGRIIRPIKQNLGRSLTLVELGQKSGWDSAYRFVSGVGITVSASISSPTHFAGAAAVTKAVGLVRTNVATIRNVTISIEIESIASVAAQLRAILDLASASC
jgi:hypothetical protein